MAANINVVLASDDNYAQHMGIVIMSCLAKSSQPERLFFYIFSNNISVKNKENIERIVKGFSASCLFIEPDIELYREIPKKRYGVAGLFRLSVDALLPDNVEKVIYLDCDVLLYSDIRELWDIELGNCVAGAVINLGHQPYARLGIADGEYFNSGVMLIDINRWREEKIGSKTLEFMNDNIDNLVYPDQDGLNEVLKNQWKHLPLRWNQQPATYSMYKKKRFQKSLTHQDYCDAIYNPAIVHFSSRNKPWHYLTYHPLKETYNDYLKKSPWSGYQPTDFTVKNIIKKWLSVEKNIKRLYRRFITPEKIKVSS